MLSRGRKRGSPTWFGVGGPMCCKVDADFVHWSFGKQQKSMSDSKERSMEQWGTHCFLFCFLVGVKTLSSVALRQWWLAKSGGTSQEPPSHHLMAEIRKDHDTVDFDHFQACSVTGEWRNTCWCSAGNEGMNRKGIPLKETAGDGLQGVIPSFPAENQQEKVISGHALIF